MKKTYFTPEMETVELKLSGMLCVSGVEGGGSDDSSDVVNDDNPGDDWGHNF